MRRRLIGSVVAAQHRRVRSTLAGEAVKFADEMLTGDAALDQTAQALAGVLVEDRRLSPNEI